MAYDDEFDVSEREPESQFVPQEGDEEILWEVIEIIQERGKQYKVKWAGQDPATGKPWNPSWVSRQDCTDDLVLEWKRKQAAKKKKKKGAQGGRGGSVASKRSNASSSTVSKAGNVASSSKHQAESSHRAGQKRSHSSALSVPQEIMDMFPLSDAEDNVPPPTKKRKLGKSPEKELPRVSVEIKTRRKLKQKTPEAEESDVPDEHLARGKSKDSGSANAVPSRQSVKQQANERRRRSPSFSPPPPAKRRVATKEPSIQQLPSHESTRGRGLTDRNGRKPNGSSIMGRVSSLSPASKERLRQWEAEVHLNEKASTSKVSRNRSPSVGDLAAPSPPPRSPSPAGSKASARRTNGARNGHQDSYRREIVPETEPESSNNTQTQTQSQSQEVPIAAPVPVKPSSNHLLTATNGDAGTSRPWDPPRTPSAQGAKRSLQKTNSLIGKMKPRTPGSLSRTESRWSLYEDGGHDSNYQPPLSPTRAQLFTHHENSMEVDEVDTGRSPNQEKPPPVVARKGVAKGSRKDAQPEVEEEEVEDELDELDPDEPIVSLKSTKSQLLPIPRISPSKFTPYLPTSSITVENPHEEEAEEQEIVSTIEQYSSDEEGGEREEKERELPGWTKEDKGKGKAIEVVEDNGTVHMSPAKRRKRYTLYEVDSDQASQDYFDDDDDDDSSIHDRGLELAEQARQERRRSSDASIKERKGPLIKPTKAEEATKSIPNTTDKKRTKLFHSDSESEAESERSLPEKYWTRKERRRRMQEEDDSEGENLEEVRSSPPASPEVEVEESRTQEEDDFAPATPKAKGSRLDLRQEEEESTQDLLAQQRQASLPRSSPPPEDVDGVVQQDQDVDMDAYNEGGDDDDRAPVASSPPAQQPDEDQDMEERPNGRATEKPVEKLPSPAPPPPRPTRKAQSPEVPSSSPAVPEEPKAGSPSFSPPPTKDQARPPSADRQSPNGVAQVSAPPPPAPAAASTHMSSTTTESVIQANRIARLEALLFAEQTKTAALETEISALKDALVNASVSIPPQDTAQLQALRAQVEQQKQEWEAEKLVLTTSVEQLTKRKESAEKDVEFFREQYARASGFVSSVREENKELETQAKVASQQAKVGVEMVKATFEQRVKVLEDDAKMWKRLALFALEKDAATNDDIRRRAAEEPELRARITDLESDFAESEHREKVLFDLIEGRDDQIKALENENEAWRKEVMNLKEQLSEHQAVSDEKLSQESSSGSAVSTADELVYRCQWRPEGGNDSCGGVFPTAEELQEHLFASGHLQHL